MNWIKCSEIMPDKDNFLATDGKIFFVCNGKDEFGRYLIGGWETCNYCGGTSLASIKEENDSVKKIIKWMPLPTLPEEI